MNELANSSNLISERFKKGMQRLSIVISVLQIIGQFFEYSKFFKFYPLPQKIMQATILLIIIFSFIISLRDRKKYYVINFLILSYCTIISITFSIVFFPEFYATIGIRQDMFFMRNMLFIFAYIGFVGLISNRKHIWIQGAMTVLYISFEFSITYDKFLLTSLPLYYLATFGYCVILSFTVNYLTQFIHGLNDSNEMNFTLQKINLTKKNKLESYNLAIIDLAKKKFESKGLGDDNLDVFEEIIKTISINLNCSRTSIWLLSDNNNSINKKALIDSGKFDNSPFKLYEQDFPKYFEGILNLPYISASDAETHYNTIEFTDSYLKPLNIVSMLDCPIKLNNTVIGVVCCENILEKKDWELEDILFLQSISDYIALHLKNVQINSLLDSLKVKNREILDSINYAKRLQSAILPPPKLVAKYLANSFILYKPKDIVAGDFYWMEVIEDNIIFALADCTGHGVPGAMVSVVCHNALNRAVRDYKLIDPAEILNKTRELVIEQFENSEEDVNDGMDISLCVYNRKKGILNWAGANSPLIIHRSEEISKIKPDKQPVGNYITIKSFTTVSVSVNQGDLVYLYTDGYIDQFGGDRDKKMKYKKLYELVNEFHVEEMSKQKLLFDKAFEDWKGENEQVDDVCMIGVRFED